VLGRIGLKPIELVEGPAEVPYWVLPRARGRRLAATSLAVLADWLFAAIGLHRIELTHSTLHPASCRAAERASFQLEGVKRQEALHPDGRHDMHLHARLASDSADRAPSG
jgi:[ribosomal protein S5]-alanine N-acetyltransferase